MGDDDLIGDILRASDDRSPDPEPAARRDLGALIARVAGSARSEAEEAATAAGDGADDLVLQALPAEAWPAILRRLPDDQLVPLLAGAGAPLIETVAAALDEAAREWLRSQLRAGRPVSRQAHAQAAAKARALAERLAAQERLLPDTAPEAPAPATTGDEAAEAPRPGSSALGMDFRVGVAAEDDSADGDAPSERHRPSSAVRPLPDRDLLELLAQLIGAARDAGAADLQRLASGVEDQALARGLQLLAEGGDAHQLREVLDQCEYEAMDALRRRHGLIREALLSLCFGEGAEDFRRRCAGSP